MVTANPFRGLRFDPAVVGDPGRVLAPPYDVISPQAREGYEAASPYNMVRLILSREPAEVGDRYDQAAKLLRSWVDERALVLEAAPALYAYEQRYTLAGERRVQRGVLASVPLDPDGSLVLPHERTMTGPVADRLRLLAATDVNHSPVFAVFAGEGAARGAVAAMCAGPAALDCTDETGVGHRMWPVTDPGLIATWQAALAGRRLLIADGHHRYRTSLAYRAQMRAAYPGHPEGPWDELLMFLADADDEGPSVLPIHRLCAGVTAEAIVTAAADLFDARPVAGPAEARQAIDDGPRERPAFGVHGQGRTWALVARDPARLAAETGRDRPLDVEVLHGPLLARRLGVVDFEHRVVYEPDLHEGAARVDRGEFGALVVLRPVTVAAVLERARNGEILPQKTTFFHPKPRDGIVLRPLEPDAFKR
ncbi:MAG TPA: DUF1015 domain-containing protein [Actinomycetes bacterium]|nr:DUF1015 domain-containing protein [Actinomycetes bacterium]